jgi:hypothetical protein
MMNITPQLTETSEEPTSPSEPLQCLELGNKSKGSPPPVDNSLKMTKGKDKHHEQEYGDVL